MRSKHVSQKQKPDTLRLLPLHRLTRGLPVRRTSTAGGCEPLPLDTNLQRFRNASLLRHHPPSLLPLAGPDENEAEKPEKQDRTKEAR